MPSFRTSSSLLAMAATAAFAAPATAPGTKFSVTQVPAGQKYLSGPIEMLRTYQKYSLIGAVAPEVVQAAAARAKQSGSVTASPTQYDASYLCPVTAGSQTFMLNFDTGSSDLWVFSTYLPKSEDDGQTEYNPKDSPTAKQLQGYTWDISYEDGSGAKGIVFADKVVVGGVTATSQAVEAATSVSSEFTEQKTTDGLLGLGFNSLNTVTPKKQTTFFSTVSSTLAMDLFAADLKYHAPGSYDFGFIDSSKYTGDIYYTPVNDNPGYWKFTAGGYAIGAGGKPSGKLGESIADTGTTLFYLPAAVVEAYYAQVDGAFDSVTEGGYVFPCSSKLPDFVVSIGGGTFTVPGTYINYAPATSELSGLLGKDCFGGIQSNTGIGFNIFGDIFLKSVYAVFDQTQATPRLGFAEQS